MSQALLLPSWRGITAGLIVAAGFFFVYSRTQKKAATGILAQARAEAERIRNEADRRASSMRAPKPCSPPRWRRCSCARSWSRSSSGGGRKWARLERRVEERNQVAERRQAELDTQQREMGKRVQQLDVRDKAIAGREQEAARFAAEQQAEAGADRRAEAEDARRELLQRVEDEARGAGAGAGARHQGAGAEGRRSRGPPDHRHRHPAHRRRAHRRDHRVGRDPAERRDEGAHHRARGTEHPRVRDRHRRGRHHRRHAGHRGDLLLRPDPPGGGAPLARGADRRRPHPSGPHRGSGGQDARGAGTAAGRAGRAGGLSTRTCMGCTRS